MLCTHAGCLCHPGVWQAIRARRQEWDGQNHPPATPGCPPHKGHPRELPDSACGARGELPRPPLLFHLPTPPAACFTSCTTPGALTSREIGREHTRSVSSQQPLTPVALGSAGDGGGDERAGDHPTLRHGAHPAAAGGGQDHGAAQRQRGAGQRARTRSRRRRQRHQGKVEACGLCLCRPRSGSKARKGGSGPLPSPALRASVRTSPCQRPAMRPNADGWPLWKG